MSHQLPALPYDAAALELAKLCPVPYGHIEIRPVWEFNG